MSLIHRQINTLLETNESNNSSSINLSFKHSLKCKSCMWKITFYESTGSMRLNSEKMRCPVCRGRNKIAVSKIIS